MNNIHKINPEVFKMNLKGLQFHQSRIMFYIDKHYNPVFSENVYKDLSHKEWFKAINIDIETYIRGYIKYDYAHIYIGESFEIPNLSISNLIRLSKILRVNTIKLGCKVNTIGTLWEGKIEFMNHE